MRTHKKHVNNIIPKVAVYIMSRIYIKKCQPLNVNYEFDVRRFFCAMVFCIRHHIPIEPIVTTNQATAMTMKTS